MKTSKRNKIRKVKRYIVIGKTGYVKKTSNQIKEGPVNQMVEY